MSGRSRNVPVSPFLDGECGKEAAPSAINRLGEGGRWVVVVPAECVASRFCCVTWLVASEAAVKQFEEVRSSLPGKVAAIDSALSNHFRYGTLSEAAA